VKSTAFCLAIGLKIITGFALFAALAVLPVRTFAQRGAAAGRAGGARPGVARAPVVRAPAPAVNRPVSVPPVVTRPGVARPVGVAPITTMHMPVTPLRMPVTPLRMPLTSGIRFPSRPPLRFPITPVLGTAGFFGLRSNPFFNTGLFFPACSPFMGFSLGCSALAPFYGISYGPVISYPPVVYPSDPAYPPDPVYNPPAPSATLQYAPPTSQYPSFATVPAEDLTSGNTSGLRLRGETLLYLQDGSVFAVSSYTVSDGTLHYVTSYGERNDVAVDRLDLKKTIEANAARGVAFTLTPPAASGGGVSGPSPLGPAPAPEGPIIPAKP
jgi:hypothetical protein